MEAEAVFVAWCTDFDVSVRKSANLSALRGELAGYEYTIGYAHVLHWITLVTMVISVLRYLYMLNSRGLVFCRHLHSYCPFLFFTKPRWHQVLNLHLVWRWNVFVPRLAHWKVEQPFSSTTSPYGQTSDDRRSLGVGRGHMLLPTELRPCMIVGIATDAFGGLRMTYSAAGNTFGGCFLPVNNSVKLWRQSVTSLFDFDLCGDSSLSWSLV